MKFQIDPIVCACPSLQFMPTTDRYVAAKEHVYRGNTLTGFHDESNIILYFPYYMLLLQRTCEYHRTLRCQANK